MDDLISRQDAIDALCNSFCGGHHDCEFYPECGNLEDIQAVPSAEPDKDLIHLQKEQAYMQGYEDGRKSRKKGKWIDKSDDIDGAWNYCSVCGEQAIDLYDFCPNCGAEMREGEEDE